MDEHGLLLTHRIKPEGAVYLSSDCAIRLSAYSAVSSLAVNFSGQYLASDGEPHYFERSVTPTNDRAESQVTIPIGECVLLSLVATLSSGNANRGQCYVRARVHRGSGTPLLYTHQLIGEYLTDDFFPAFPVNPIRGPLEGPGMIRSVTGTDQAANTEVTETVPTGARWLLHGMHVVLVTDANVANRTVRLVLDDGTTTLYQAATPTAVPAGNTFRYSFSPVGANVANGTGNEQVSMIPVACVLAAGYRIRTATTNLQVGDNYGAPQLWVEEWLEA